MTQTLPGIPELPNQTTCRVVSDPALVAARLAELDTSLDEALLREVSEHGYRQRVEATPFHATTAAGTYHYHGAVFAIRSMLANRGWHLENLRNCPFIVSPDRAIAIVVMTGDMDTGRIDGRPTNQAVKGAVLKQAVAKNQEQLKLFDAGFVSAALAGSREATQLWVLLYHVALGEDGNDEIRIELSLPSRFEKKQIADWHERLILGAIRPDGEVGGLRDAPTGPIDVPVERRTGT